MTENTHKAGFVNIVGKPNVGKSTLMNTLLGEKLSITTKKAQTTRHSILGIANDTHFQIIYTDTPGMLTPKYALQQSMMRAVRHAFIEVDVLLWVVDACDQACLTDVPPKWLLNTTPTLLIINKVDQIDQETLAALQQHCVEQVAVTSIIPISALNAYNTTEVFLKILAHLPTHPPYYPKDMLTDRPTRFFVAEIVREKILQHYHQEVPYSVEVVVDAFQEEAQLVKISVHIHTERPSQKGILIGHQGRALKTIGMAARLDLEKFLGKKVFLAQYVKVTPGWRTKAQLLQRFGYQ